MTDPFRPLSLLALGLCLLTAGPSSAKEAHGPSPRPSAPAAQTAAPPEQRAEAMLRAMEALIARQAESDPLEQMTLERRLGSYAAEFRPLGLSALPALSACLEDRLRPHKLRSYCAAFLGMLGDPAALAPLRERLSDPKEEPVLRSAAMQAAASLRLEPAARRTLAEGAAFDPASPEPLVREALAVLAETGSDDADALRRLAKRRGSAPEGLREHAALDAVSALAASRRASEGALIELAVFFRRGTRLRAEAIAALRSRKPKLSDLPPGGFDELRALMLRDGGRPSMEVARLFAQAGDRRAVPSLIQLLKDDEPALLAEAAEALVKLGDPEAAEPLARLNEGLISDKRFAAGRKGVDPRPYALRIQKASEFFTRSLYAASQTETPPAPGAAPARRTPGPFRYVGWPTSAKPQPHWSGRRPELILRAQPEEGAPFVTTKLPDGQPLPVLDSIVATLEPGALRARRTLRAEFRDLGRERLLKPSDYEAPVLRVNLDLVEGKTLELLAHRPEGACFLRSEDRLLLGECQTQASERDFELVAEPKVRWWLKTKVTNAEGWYPADDEGVDFTR